MVRRRDWSAFAPCLFRRFLLSVFGFFRRILALHLEFADELERELS
jgi:hypothetical protein